MSSGEDILTLPPALPPSSNICFTDRWKTLFHTQPRNTETSESTTTVLKSEDDTTTQNEIFAQGSGKTRTRGRKRKSEGPRDRPKSDKRRESVITNDRGVVLKKICSIQECNKIVTVRVDRYLALKSGKLCKGNMNTKRLFVREDIVDVINPIDSMCDKSCIISRKQTHGNRVDMYARVLHDYTDCLTFKGKYLQMFKSQKEGITKTDSRVCYQIKPIDKTEIWIEEPYAVKDIKDCTDDYSFEERSSLEPMESDSENEEEEERKKKKKECVTDVTNTNSNTNNIGTTTFVITTTSTPTTDNHVTTTSTTVTTIPNIVNTNNTNNTNNTENSNQKITQTSQTNQTGQNSQTGQSLQGYGIGPIFPALGNSLGTNKVVFNSINFGAPFQQNNKPCQLPSLVSVLSQPSILSSPFLSSSASLGSLTSSPPSFLSPSSSSSSLSSRPTILSSTMIPPISVSQEPKCLGGIPTISTSQI